MRTHNRPQMTTVDIREQVSLAIGACEDKKANDVSLLQLDKDSSALCDFFVICSGTNPRQIQAIADEVELRLKRLGNYPNHIEGYNQAEWVLMDYVDFVVHVFSENARKYYSLERLWKSAKQLTREELLAVQAKVTHALATGDLIAARPKSARRGGHGSKRKSSSSVAKALKKPAKAKKSAKKSSAKSRSKKKK